AQVYVYLRGCRDVAHNLVLDVEYVACWTVITLCPAMVARHAVDQLRAYPIPLPCPAYASLHDITNAQLLCDALRVHFLAFVDKAGGPRDHSQAADMRQGRNDVVRQAVNKILLLRIAAHVDERQHGNRRLVARRRASGWRLVHFV